MEVPKDIKDRWHWSKGFSQSWWNHTPMSTNFSGHPSGYSQNNQQNNLICKSWHHWLLPILLMESFSSNSVSPRLWAIIWPFKQWDWHQGPQLCLANDLRKNIWLSTLSNLPKGFVCVLAQKQETHQPHTFCFVIIIGLSSFRSQKREET